MVMTTFLTDKPGVDARRVTQRKPFSDCRSTVGLGLAGWLTPNRRHASENVIQQTSCCASSISPSIRILGFVVFQGSVKRRGRLYIRILVFCNIEADIHLIDLHHQLVEKVAIPVPSSYQIADCLCASFNIVCVE
jgi:hypothetical protein